MIDEGKLTPYKTDLEYLVDAVELVSRKGRLYQAGTAATFSREGC